jgi:RTX calcium-binding nonapeptide repeat (4 copies)
MQARARTRSGAASPRCAPAFANIENLTLVGGALSGQGNGLANIITGNDKDNELIGGGGNDTLIGGAGADTLSAVPTIPSCS